MNNENYELSDLVDEDPNDDRDPPRERREKQPATPVTEKLFKLRKKLGDDLCDELEALDSESLRNRIVAAESNIQISEDALAENEEVQALKESLKEAVGPFRDAIKHQRAVARFCSLSLDSGRVK